MMGITILEDDFEKLSPMSLFPGLLPKGKKHGFCICPWEGGKPPTEVAFTSCDEPGTHSLLGGRERF